MPKTPVLMAPHNPEGWKLEELLDVLRDEIIAKNMKISSAAARGRFPEADPRDKAALAVRSNNRAILTLLAQAHALQVDSMRQLDAIGPNQGPLGTPRIGVGSENETDFRHNACKAEAA